MNDTEIGVSLLKERFKAIKQETIDIAVSSINAYRDFIGNGVAVGKLAEPIFSKLLNAPDEEFHAFHFAFSGKNPPFDIMLYRAKSEIPKARFVEVKKLYSSDFEKFQDAISSIVGGKDWCGISLKNYKDKAAQISTNYRIRDLCEAELGTVERVIDEASVVKNMFSRVVSELSHETILFLNSFPKDSTYQIALFEPQKIHITDIQFKTFKVHSRYIFRQDGHAVFHEKYGKNRNNPYQRGMWLDDLSKLTILRRGNFRKSNFGEFIVEGAFRIHPPVHGT